MLFLALHGWAILCLSLYAFVVWWKGRIHRQNVDRLCTSLERQARAGYPVTDPGHSLYAIRPSAPTLHIGRRREQP